MTGIEKAVMWAGNQSILARLLGVTPQAVQQWVERGYVAREKIVDISNMSGIARAELADPNWVEILKGD